MTDMPDRYGWRYQLVIVIVIIIIIVVVVVVVVAAVDMSSSTVSITRFYDLFFYNTRYRGRLQAINCSARDDIDDDVQMMLCLCLHNKHSTGRCDVSGGPKGLHGLIRVQDHPDV